MISKLKAFLRLYFGVSRREVNGLVILIPLTIALVFLPAVVRQILKNTTNDQADKEFTRQIADRIRKLSHKPKVSTDEQSSPNPELFKFDPNLTNKEDLLLLGLSPKQAQNIINYRSKGGQFRIRSDLSKIYSISKEEYRRLLPFIDLPDEIVYHKVNQKYPMTERTTDKKTEIKDINTASADDLQEIRGIGAVLSQRIVKFRDALGGFYSIHQLKEVYGLTDSVSMKVEKRFAVSESSTLSKLRLDTCSAVELARHPYITHKLARIVTKYREQHSFDSIEQLLQIKVISDTLFLKLRPYLAIEQ